MMRTLRVLLVDDEPPAIAGLRALLATHADVEIVGEALGGRAAIAAMASSAPDLVLLDVQMPEVDGFRVAEAALRLGGDAVPVIIFVTAFDAHAVRAFDVGAADYLLKPVETTRFARALARARQVVGVADAAARARDLVRVLSAHAAPAAFEAPIAPPGPARTFVVRVGTREVRVPAEEIAWVEADDYCAVLHRHDGRRHVIRETLQALEERLDAAAFVRVHRSALVRRTAIVALERHGVGQLRVVLRNGTRVGVSRARHRVVAAAFRAGS
jgi:two-component system, LytTR family, response regulator